MRALNKISLPKTNIEQFNSVSSYKNEIVSLLARNIKKEIIKAASVISKVQECFRRGEFFVTYHIQNVNPALNEIVNNYRCALEIVQRQENKSFFSDSLAICNKYNCNIEKINQIMTNTYLHKICKNNDTISKFFGRETNSNHDLKKILDELEQNGLTVSDDLIGTHTEEHHLKLQANNFTRFIEDNDCEVHFLGGVGYTIFNNSHKNGSIYILEFNAVNNLKSEVILYKDGKACYSGSIIKGEPKTGKGLIPIMRGGKYIEINGAWKDGKYDLDAYTINLDKIRNTQESFYSQLSAYFGKDVCGISLEEFANIKEVIFVNSGTHDKPIINFYDASDLQESLISKPNINPMTRTELQLININDLEDFLVRQNKI